MKEVFYGANGGIVDLVTFVDRQGPNAGLWSVQPVCKGCGKVVIPVNIKTALGFGEVSEEVAKRAFQFDRDVPTPHFRHKKGEGEGCPYDDAKDPFFEPFRENDFNIRARERVHQVLFSPQVKDFNGAVLRELYWALTKKPSIPKEDGSAIWQLAKRKVGSMSVLIQHPWIFPYAQILFAGKREVCFGSGPKTLLFYPMGKQRFDFTDFEGCRRQAVFPQGIGLYFANSYHEFKRDGKHVRYEICKREAQALVDSSKENVRRFSR